MPQNPFFFCLLSVNLLLFAACTKTEKAPMNNAVASVNGVLITEDDLYLLLQDSHNDNVAPDMRTQVLERLIDQELLYQQGLKLGLDRDPKYRNLVTLMEMRLKNLKRSEMARRVTSTKIAATVEVTNEDVKRYYDENKEKISDELHLLIMRFSEVKKAAEAHRKIKNGTPFESVAQDLYADSRSGHERPWDAGFLRWDQIPTEWTDEVYSLSKGEISGVLGSVKTGWSVVKLVDRRTNPDVSLDRVSVRIMNRLRDINISKSYKKYTADLRKDSKIFKYGERRKTS